MEAELFHADRQTDDHFGCHEKKNMCKIWFPRSGAAEFLYISNVTHNSFFSYIFIPSLYMFRAPLCSSSGESIVLIQHLVYVTLKTSEWTKITKRIS